MKKTILVMAMMLFASVAWAQDEPAAEPGTTVSAEAADESLVSGGGEIDLNARYVWRGIAFSEGPTLNPYVWLTVGDLTLSSWGNFLLTDQDKEYQGQFNEVDFIAAYAFEKDAFSAEIIYQHYEYPNTEWDSTGEVELSLAWAFDAVSVYTAHSLDVEAAAGAYFAELGLSVVNEISDSTTFEGSAWLGYGNEEFNEEYVGVPIDAVDVAGVNLALTWYATDNLYLRPHLEYTSLLHQDLREAVESPDLVNVGLAAGVEF